MALIRMSEAHQNRYKALLAVYTSLKQLLAASLPNRCLMCHQSITLPATGICPICLVSGLYQQAICLGCGRGMGYQTQFCGKCQSSPSQRLPLTIVAPCSYHQGLGSSIGLIKYQAQFAALKPLTMALVERISMLRRAGLLQLPQVMLAVPLHPNRLRQRGFNQAWLIGETLARMLALPLVDWGLRRVIDTHSQAGLNGNERRNNLSNAFVLDKHFPYQRIALIDDVVTTGATAIEIAKLFERQHVAVQVWCLARAEAPGLLD